MAQRSHLGEGSSLLSPDSMKASASKLGKGGGAALRAKMSSLCLPLRQHFSMISPLCSILHSPFIGTGSNWQPGGRSLGVPYLPPEPNPPEKHQLSCLRRGGERAGILCRGLMLTVASGSDPSAAWVKSFPAFLHASSEIRAVSYAMKKGK